MLESGNEAGRLNLFKALLSATVVNDPRRSVDISLLSEIEFTLEELANSLIAIYTGNPVRAVKYSDYEYRGLTGFENALQKQLSQELSSVNGDSKVIHELKEMMAMKHSIMGWHCKFYDYFERIFPGYHHSANIINNKIFDEGKEFLKNCPEKDLIEKIAKQMRNISEKT